MKIDFDLKNEKEAMPELLKQKNISLVDIFDKALVIEKLWERLPNGKTARVLLDEEDKDYPNILGDKPPRFIVQNFETSKKFDFNEYLNEIKKEGFDISLEQQKGKYFLTMRKNKDDKLNLGLRLDRARTISLSLLAKNKSFYGIKSYYYKKREE